MRRLFTFGCSFTRYKWPTWADIVGTGFDLHQNWGLRGAGNNYIANSVIECDLTQKFTSDDTVIVQWSSVTREDRYVNGSWIVAGNVLGSEQPIYDRKFVDKMIDIRGCYVRDLAFITMIKKYLKNCGVNAVYISMSDLDDPDLQETYQTLSREITDKKSDILDLLLHHRDSIREIRSSITRVIFDNNWDSREWINPGSPDFQNAQLKYESCAGEAWPSFIDFIHNRFDKLSQAIHDEIFDTTRWNWAPWTQRLKRCDPHPTPLEHLEYVDKILSEFKITESVRSIITDAEHQVRSFRETQDWVDQLGVQYPARW